MLTLANLRLRARLAAGFATILGLVLLIAVLVFWGSTTNDRANDEVRAQYRKMLLARDVSSATDGIYLLVWGMLAAPDSAEAAGLKAEIAELRGSYQNKIAELKAALVTATGRQLVAELEQALADARQLNNHILELAKQGKNSVAMAQFLVEGRQRQHNLSATVRKLLDWREKRIGDAMAAAKDAKRKLLWLVLLGGFVVLGAAAWIATSLTHSISQPIAASVELVNAISRGDLTRDVPSVLLSRKDEAGDLAKAMDRLTGALRGSLLDLMNGIGTLGATSDGLQAISERLTKGAQRTADRTQAAAAAAEQSSANTISVATGMDQASANLSSVAAAAEEMSATVGEIAANSERARAISEQATAEVQQVASIMYQLGQAAKEIDKVTEAITVISSQTNLLALNATIEAARAGVAGKGFAVVASEIKELASQTGAATEDIKARIADVQSSSGNAITSMEKVTGVIREVGQLVGGIAVAIEEQAAVTKDVAANVAQASGGIKDANDRVSETATVSKTMAEDIAKVSMEGRAMNRDSSVVEADVVGLRGVSQRLLGIASKFQIGRNTVDFARIKLGHVKWRAKLLEMFEGRVSLEEKEAGDHHGCAFGQWYDGEGRQFASRPGYHKVGAHHQAFHVLVADIVRLWQAGKEDEAFARHKALLSHTAELFVLLDTLSSEAVESPT